MPWYLAPYVGDLSAFATFRRTSHPHLYHHHPIPTPLPLQAEVVANVATLMDTIKPADTTSSDGALAKIATSIAAAVDQLVLSNAMMNASSSTAVAAAAAAADSTGGAPPITYSAIIPAKDCGLSEQTACKAIYHAKDDGADDALFSLLVRTNGGGYFNAAGIYECEYTLASTGDVVTAPAVLKPEPGSMAAGRVGCTPPVQDPEKTTKATWAASVGLLEGGFKVPRVNAAGKAVDSAATLLFSSHGPVIVGIDPAVTVTKTDLAKSVATITFTVEDRDSAEENITVTVKAKNEDFVTGMYRMYMCNTLFRRHCTQSAREHAGHPEWLLRVDH